MLPAGLRLGVVGVTVSTIAATFRGRRRRRESPERRVRFRPKTRAPRRRRQLCRRRRRRRRRRSRSTVTPRTSGTTTTWCSPRLWTRRDLRVRPARGAGAPAPGGYSRRRRRFGSSNGLLATFAAPIPSPAIGALARDRPSDASSVWSPPRPRSSPRVGGGLDRVRRRVVGPLRGSLPVLPPGGTGGGGVNPRAERPCSSSSSSRRRCSRGGRGSRVGGGAVSASWAWTFACTTLRSSAFSQRGPGRDDVSGFAPRFPPPSPCPPPSPRASAPAIYPKASPRSPWAPPGRRRRRGGARRASPSSLAPPSSTSPQPPDPSVAAPPSPFTASACDRRPARRPRRARRDVRARHRSTGRGDRVGGDCRGSRSGIGRRRDGSVDSVASILWAFSYREPFAVSSASPSAVPPRGRAG